MQANTPPLVQYGAGGEQWWQIPGGAAIHTSDGVPVGTVTEVGTAYLRAGASMMADGDLHIPLQMIAMYDAQTNVVHLNATADAVRAMAGAVPANDPASLQAVACRDAADGGHARADHRAGDDHPPAPAGNRHYDLTDRREGCRRA